MNTIKPQTIENQIRYTAKPYPQIIENACKKGWRIIKDKKNKYARTVTISDHLNHNVTTCYEINNPTSAFFNSYNF